MLVVQLSIATIKFPIHAIPLAIDLLAFSIQLGALFIGDARGSIVVMMALGALPAVDFPIALIQLAHACIKITVHFLTFSV